MCFSLAWNSGRSIDCGQRHCPCQNQRDFRTDRETPAVCQGLAVLTVKWTGCFWGMLHCSGPSDLLCWTCQAWILEETWENRCLKHVQDAQGKGAAMVIPFRIYIAASCAFSDVQTSSAKDPCWICFWLLWSDDCWKYQPWQDWLVDPGISEISSDILSLSAAFLTSRNGYLCAYVATSWSILGRALGGGKHLFACLGIPKTFRNSCTIRDQVQKSCKPCILNTNSPSNSCVGSTIALYYINLYNLL